MRFSIGILAALGGISALSLPTSALAADGSVYHVSPWVDGPVIFAASLGSLIPALNDRHLLHARCPCNPGEVNALDRHVIGNDSRTAGVISDVTVGLAVLAPPALDVYALGATQQLVEDLSVYAEVLSVSGAFVTLSKYTVQRPIPRVYAGQASAADPTNYRSFYSGHTDLAFSALAAAAVTTDLRYHWGAWPWLVTAVVGLSVAEERVLAGNHFYTDVAMGALAGTFFGVTIPLLHKLDSPDQTVSVGGTRDGLQLSWARYF